MTPSETQSTIPEDIVGQTVRFPRSLHERIADVANNEDRSFSQQVVAAVRAGLAALEKPGQSELEVPSGDEPPAFRLVPRWQGEPYPPPGGHPDEPKPDPDSHAVEVEGRIVPLLEVGMHPAPFDPWWMSLDGRFGIQAATYEELWRWGWFVAHAMAIGEGRASHAYPSRIRQLVDEGWAIMDESDCGGAGYEVTVTYHLPSMGDSDQWAYDVRDMLSKAAHDAGARDVCTRLTGLAPLEIDRRGRTADEIAAIVELDSRPKPISQVLTVPSRADADGTVEETTIEIGVATIDET